MKLLAHSLTMSPARYAVPAGLALAALVLLAGPYPFLAPVPGLAVMALLWFGQHTRRALLFYGIVLLIPFGSFRGVGDAGMLRLHWLLAAALAALVVVDILRRGTLPEAWRARPFWCLVLAFYAVNAIAALGSDFQDVSLRFMVLLGAAFTLVALGMLLIDGAGFVRILPRVVVASVFTSSVLAVLGYMLDLPLFISPVSGRAVGGTPHPNNMALMTIFSLPLTVGLILTARSLFSRLALLAVFATNVLAVILTFSRGGAIILALSVPLMLWEFRRMIAPRNLGLLLGTGGLVLALLLVLVPDTYTGRLRSIRDADDFAMNRRLSYIQVARDLVRQRPLLGSGPDTFAPLYAASELGRSFTRPHESGLRKAHNTYIEVLVGTGLVGLCLFIAILMHALLCFGRARARFMARGLAAEALLTGAYRVAFLTLLLYLFFFSDVYHKYLLLSLALAQVAHRLASQDAAQEVSYAGG